MKLIDQNYNALKISILILWSRRRQFSDQIVDLKYLQRMDSREIFNYLVENKSQDF